MSEDLFLATPIIAPDEGSLVYCVQCLSGHERGLAERIGLHYPEIEAIAVMQERHRSQGGTKTLTQQVMLPGYVFLFSRRPIPFHQILPVPNVVRFLSYGNAEDRVLRGEDLVFANWIKRYGGILSCSKAIREGSQLRIIHGPLKDHVGTVGKVDRHNRNISLNIVFSGNVRTVWMPFQWAEEVAQPLPSGFYNNKFETD